MNHTEPDQDPLAQAAGRLLRDSEDIIDALTAARLAAGRRRAVAALTPAARWWQVFGQRWPVLASGLATAVLLAVLLPRSGQAPGDAQGFDYSVANDAAIYEQLDFYLWADELDPAG